jgi:chromosome segregation ATPase
MRPTSLVVPIGLALFATGCVSRSEHDAAKQQIADCERDKIAAQKSASDCEGRIDTESKRWDAIQSQLTSTLPETLKNFQDERTKIIQIVPEQVRNEVGKRLDRYFVNVSKQMERMEGKVEGLREQLDASRAQIAELSATTRSVDSKIEETHKAVLQEQGRLGDQKRKISELVGEIAEFDRNHVSCEKCKERIKLKSEGRSMLLAFHSQLIQRLQSLPNEAAKP